MSEVILLVGHCSREPAGNREGLALTSGSALAPADFARRFVLATTWTNGVFWLLLGSVSAWLFQRLGRV